MSEPTQQELQESIEELTAYHDRLQKEVIKISQKLGMPKNKIESTIDEHAELKNIEEIISKLSKQRDKDKHE